MYASGDGFADLSIFRITLGKGPCDPVYQGKTVHEWVELLRRGKGRNRRIAGEILEWIDPRAKTAVPALIQTLQHPEAEVRTVAAEALSQIGPDAKEAVDVLALALKDRDSDVRTQAAWALGEIGPQAKDAAGALTAALKDIDPWVRVDAAFALWKINGSTSGVSTLAGALKDGDRLLRRRAADVLAEMGPDASFP